MAPDGAKAPPPDQGMNLGEKTVKDLIENERFAFDGNTIHVSGDLKNIREPWLQFDASGNNTGHFIPVRLPAACKGREITVNDRRVTVDDDLLLVQRLENLTGTTATIEMDGETLMVLDFTPMVPTGEKAWDAEKTDFGRFGMMEEFVENLDISWNGSKGTASGRLKNFNGNNKVSAGYYFPLSLADWFDGVNKTVTIKNSSTVMDKDIICAIPDTASIRVEFQGLTVLELDLSTMTK